MGVDPTTDPDFMAAAPSDQLKYLSHIDPDFAAANPVDQLSYLSHLRGDGLVGGAPRGVGPTGSIQVQGAMPVPEPRNMMENNPTAGLPGGTTGAPVIANNTATAVGAGVMGAASLAIPGVAPAVARWAIPTAASYGISQARKLPVVGPVIDKIPFAEAIPWLFAGGKSAPKAEPTFPGAPLPENPGTFPGAPFPEKPPTEILQSRGLGEGPQSGAPIPGAALGERPQTFRPEGGPPEATPVPKLSTPSSLNNPVGLGVKDMQPTPPSPESASGRARTTHQGYDPQNQVATFRFPNGQATEYHGISPQNWSDYTNSRNLNKGFEQNIVNRAVFSRPIPRVTPAQQAVQGLKRQ